MPVILLRRNTSVFGNHISDFGVKIRGLEQVTGQDRNVLFFGAIGRQTAMHRPLVILLNTMSEGETNGWKDSN